MLLVLVVSLLLACSLYRVDTEVKGIGCIIVSFAGICFWLVYVGHEVFGFLVLFIYVGAIAMLFLFIVMLVGSSRVSVSRFGVFELFVVIFLVLGYDGSSYARVDSFTWLGIFMYGFGGDIVFYVGLLLLVGLVGGVYVSRK